MVALMSSLIFNDFVFLLVRPEEYRYERKLAYPPLKEIDPLDFLYSLLIVVRGRNLLFLKSKKKSIWCS